MTPINEKAKRLATAGADAAEVRACSPLPSECTNIHAPGIETGYDNKTTAKLCNPYIRDVGICYMWPGQVPGTSGSYGMSNENTLPQSAGWHTLCSTWKDDWDKLPVVVTKQQATDQPTTDDVWDSAVKVRTPGKQGYDYLSDLHLRDNWADTGSEPSPGNFWESPDLFFRQAPEDPASFNNLAVDFHVDPLAKIENWAYARIHNIGQQPIMHAFVKFYMAYPWSPNPKWQRIGHGTARNILPGEVRVVRSVKPYVPPFATEHACLLAMVDSNQDFIRVVDWGAYDEAKGPTPEVVNVQDDNNVAQRNIAVVSLAAGHWHIIKAFALGVGGLRPERADFDLEIERGTLPRGVAIGVGFPTLTQAVLERAKLDKAVKLERYTNVIHPWALRRIEHNAKVGLTLGGLVPRNGSRGLGENAEISAADRPLRVSMPGISFAGARVGRVRGLSLNFEPNEPVMAELKLELPEDVPLGEHRIVIRQFRQRRLLGGITLVLRVVRPENFMFFLDMTTGLLHRSGAPTLKGLRQRNLAPMHLPERALRLGARTAEEG